MLEKNKDYLEMRVSSTDCAFAQNEWSQVRVDGYVYTTYMNIPDPGEFYILISKEKFEKLQANVNINAELAKQWEINYDLLLKKTGFDTVESLVIYLNNVGQDTLLNTLASYISERDNALEECEVMKKELYRREKDVKTLNGALREWKEGTNCSSPSAAKTLFEYYLGENKKLQKENQKLTDYVELWKNVTGYSTPEDYLHARISGAFHTPFDYTAAWQKATGCDTPDQVKSRIEDLENAVRLTNKNMLSELDSEIEEWQKATGCNIPEQAKERIKALNERINELEVDYNHLLCTTGFESEGEIEDALDKCDHSTLRKALVDYEFDYEELLKLTGYKSNQDIRVALNYSDQFVYETMRELINSLKRQAKYTNLNWQNSTGFVTPEKCGEYIKKLEDKLSRINTISEEV